MRLLVLHAELGTLRGGGENFTRNLLTSFVALGHQARVLFTADPLGRYPFHLTPDLHAIPVRGMWSRSFGQGSLSAVGRRLGSWHPLGKQWERLQHGLAWRTIHRYNRGFQRRVVRELEAVTRDVDAIYVHSNPYLAEAAAKVRPTVLRLPGPVTAELAPVLSNIHAVCANGDALARVRGFLGERAVELPIGLDHELFAPARTSRRAALGWPAEDKVIGYVGRLSRIKGVDVLAAGYRELRKRQPRARLLIVGSGEEEKNLRAVLNTELSQGAAHLAGDIHHEQLPDWYRAMDVMVMPSRYENYSNAILEGLACEVPFVGSDVGGNRALLASGAGLLFEANAPLSLAAVLDTALSHRERLQAQGRRGRSYVQERYSWSVTARRLETILLGLPARISVGDLAAADRDLSVNPVGVPR